ncbi:MAG: HAD family hydrolase [Thermomicrobiales bacterium]
MQLITFDFHNTLASCDSWFDLEVFTIASSVASALGLEADGEALNAAYRDIRARVMQSGIEISAAEAVISVFRSQAIDASPEQIETTVDDLMWNSMHDLSAKPGAVATVIDLKQLGYQLGVISSAAHHGFVEWSLEHFGILDRFDFVLTSVKAGVYKSSPDIYHQALGLADATASQSFHLGDSIKWDVETASRAGMRTGWLTSDQRYQSTAVPDLAFASLENAGPVIHDYMRSLI